MNTPPFPGGHNTAVLLTPNDIGRTFVREGKEEQEGNEEEEEEKVERSRSYNHNSDSDSDMYDDLEPIRIGRRHHRLSRRP